MAGTVAYGKTGRSNVDHRDSALQLVVARLVEEIAETDGTGGLAGEIESQSSGGTSEHSHDRIQFFAVALKIGASHGEVGAIQRRRSCEQSDIPLVEKSARALGCVAWSRNENG